MIHEAVAWLVDFSLTSRGSRVAESWIINVMDYLLKSPRQVFASILRVQSRS